MVNPLGAAGATGSCRVTSGTSAAANSYLSAGAVDTTQFSEIGVYFDDLIQDTDAISGMSLSFGLINVPTSIGVGYGHENTVAAAQALFWNGTAAKEYDASETPFYAASSNNISQRKSYGMIYRPVEQAVYLVGNERQVMWRQAVVTQANFPTTTLLTPSISIYNSDATAHWFQFSRFRLELVSG